MYCYCVYKLPVACLWHKKATLKGWSPPSTFYMSSRCHTQAGGVNQPGKQESFSLALHIGFNIWQKTLSSPFQMALYNFLIQTSWKPSLKMFLYLKREFTFSLILDSWLLGHKELALVACSRTILNLSNPSSIKELLVISFCYHIPLKNVSFPRQTSSVCPLFLTSCGFQILH